MYNLASVFGIDQLIAPAASGFVRVQETLDLAGYDQLTRFAPLWALMRNGIPALADQLIPPTWSAHEMTVDLDFQYRRGASSQIDVEISILDAGYSARFQQSKFGRCHIHVQLRRSDLITRRIPDAQPDN
jgi:hypothetical protein